MKQLLTVLGLSLLGSIAGAQDKDKRTKDKDLRAEILKDVDKRLKEHKDDILREIRKLISEIVCNTKI